MAAAFVLLLALGAQARAAQRGPALPGEIPAVIAVPAAGESVAAPAAPAAPALGAIPELPGTPAIPQAPAGPQTPAPAVLKPEAVRPETARPEAPGPAAVERELGGFDPGQIERNPSASGEEQKAAAVDFFRAVNATGALRERQRAVRDGKAGPLPPEARDHVYLFVPGFSWDILPDYFGPNIRRLRELGLDAKLVKTSPLRSSRENAKLVRAAIEAAGKDVVLIGHSKGGNDILAALERFPELQARVSRVVALQSPYAGTALADWFLSKPALYVAALAYSRLINPRRIFEVNPLESRRTIVEMSRRRRSAQALQPPALDPRVKVYSVASLVRDDTAVKILMFITAAAVKALTGRHSDGVIAPEEAVIPGSVYALLHHVGHVDTVSEPSQWRHRILGVRGHDPNFAADLTEAMVRWIFPAP